MGSTYFVWFGIGVIGLVGLAFVLIASFAGGRDDTGGCDFELLRAFLRDESASMQTVSGFHHGQMNESAARDVLKVPTAAEDSEPETGRRQVAVNQWYVPHRR